MACCAMEGTDQSFSRQAKRYARKFRKNGVDRAQRLIVDGLERYGIDGRAILEIGCGVGGLHITLLRKGCLSAVGVEMSAGMIRQAKELALEFGVADKVAYFHGDFASDGIVTQQTQIVVMDKVLCCYRNPAMLIEKSTRQADVFYAVSYPRAGWLARLSFISMEYLGRALRLSFHPFYHPPSLLDDLVLRQGFKEVESATTPIWQVKIFRRAN